ncbi:unnamed protein product, partial [Callosobruchus maculatus]
MFISGISRLVLLIVHRKKLRHILAAIDHFWMKNDQVDSNDVYVKLMFQCYAFNTVVCIAYFLAQMAILGGPASFPSYVPVWTPFYVVYIYETFLVMTGFILPVVF